MVRLVEIAESGFKKMARTSHFAKTFRATNLLY